ncbi:hypothetical protein DSO57_1015493 [Entomophthora muscae]|uniref:Uncharacterized protein n=1 Tax=Entomophthora muscae TaxID=34485 RepID=A0ACC2UER8_9FUNG|nr:hypothetical protein DSO57_1015493 [Entomophthora muscae]
MSSRPNIPSFPTATTTAYPDQNELRDNIVMSSSNSIEDSSEDSDVFEDINDSKSSEPVGSEIPEDLCSINYLTGTINPFRLQRAEHSCKKLELGARNQKGGLKSKREYSHRLAAVEITGIFRQPFKAIKNQLREIGIVAEMTPSLHFISSQALEIIIPQFYLADFISLVLSQKSSNNKPFKNWKIISVQKISL